MNEPIYFIGGSKGGVGKSIVSWALIDYLREHDKKILLFDTDSSNPDVFKSHKPHENDNLICETVNLDTSEGWIEIINIAEGFKDFAIIINSAARSNTGITNYGRSLTETLPELERKLVTFWVLNRQRDSVELFRSFNNVFPDATVFACRNLYFGDSEKFEIYNSSQVRETIEKKGLTLDFPDLADRVADKLYYNRQPIYKAITELPLGHRAELRRWRAECTAMFDKAMESTK